MTIDGVCWLIADHYHTSGTDSKTMSVSSPNLTDLPVETLEQILLNLPGADIVKIEVVECFVPSHMFRCSIVHFPLYGLG